MYDNFDGNEIKDALIKLSKDDELIETGSAKEIYDRITQLLNTKESDIITELPEGYLSPDEVVKLVDMIASVNKRYSKQYNSKNLKEITVWDFFIMTAKYKEDK